MVSVVQAILQTIRDRFGGKLKVSFVGGAATSMEVLNFFENIDIKILEGYGLTETSPLVTVNTPEQVSWKPGRRARFVSWVLSKQMARLRFFQWHLFAQDGACAGGRASAVDGILAKILALIFFFLLHGLVCAWV